MATWMGGSEERPARFFSGPADFRAWLDKHAATSTELWMGLNKKHVPDRGLTWEQAVPEALCYGWIDSTSQRIDDDATRQRWTPRKPNSTWSAVNIALVAELTAAGRMRPAGLAAFERRRSDKQAIYSYENAARELPADYAARLAADPAATEFWLGRATPSYRKAAIAWVLDAKQQATRDRRMAQLVDDCAHNRLIPPQRYGTPPAWVTRGPDPGWSPR